MTKEISGDRSVTLSVVLIFTGVIFESMNKYEQDITLPINVHTMVLTLKQQITSSLKPLEDNDLVTQAALLDPRYKKLAFTNISEQKYTNALNKLRQKVCYYYH